MKKLKLLLVGSGVVLLLGGIGWWLNERRFPPDERVYRSLSRDLYFYVVLARIHSQMPGAWPQAQLERGSFFLLQRLDEKGEQLVASGYFTNYNFVITNFPPQVTNESLMSAEVTRRLQRLTNHAEYSSYTGPNDDGKISLRCRQHMLPEFLRVMNEP